MRILMINHEFTITGSSTAFFRLALHLRGQGHSITIFPCNPAHGPIRDRYDEASIPVGRTAVTTEFDLAIASTICSAPVMLRLAPDLPVIWFVNEAEVALALLRTNAQWADAFHRATAVIYNMPFQRDVFASFTYDLNPAKLHVIPFGVDVDTASLPTASVPAKTRALRVVQLGTIEPRKRPGDLIEAVARSGLDLECVVCGTDYALRPDARALVRADPTRFRLLSGLPDAEVLAWVASADMFCLASVSETQALAVYQAGLLARPLILSDLRCYDGVFAHGRNCLLFPAGHLDMLAGSLAMLAGSPALRHELGQAARVTALRFSNRRFFASFDSVLHDVLSTHRA